MIYYTFIGLLTLGTLLIWFDGKEKPKKKIRASKKTKKTKKDLNDWFAVVVSATRSSGGNGNDSCK